MQTLYTKLPITKQDEWVVKAIARIKNWTEKEALEKWEALDDEKRRELAKNSRIRGQILILRGEEAQRKLDSLQSHPNTSLLHRKVVEEKNSDIALAHQLCEWMQWPHHATLHALRHLDEIERVRLTTKEGKRLLTRLSREFNMDEYPDKCSARDIADLLDEVLRRQVV